MDVVCGWPWMKTLVLVESNLSGSKGALHRAGGDGGDSLRRRDSGRVSAGVAGPVDFWRNSPTLAVAAAANFCWWISWVFQPVENCW